MLHHKKLLAPSLIFIGFLFGSVCLNATVPAPSPAKCDPIEQVEAREVGGDLEEDCHCAPRNN